MSIYTKFGDQGNTSLIGGMIVPKTDLRVEAYGSVDELNSVLGIIIAFNEDLREINESLVKIQNDLFVIGAELASSRKKTKGLQSTRVYDLEAEIDKIEEQLSRLSNFILPGGSKTAALIHHARTVCRRTERCIVALSQKEKINSNLIIYMNRLSDLLFVQARFVNMKKKASEIIWKRKM